MKTRLLVAFSMLALLCVVRSEAQVGGDSNNVIGVSSADLGSPISAENGKIYIADASNSRLFVITAADDSVATISLPGQPGTMGGALALSKDKSLLAIPLKSGDISVLNLSSGTVVGTYDTGGRVPISTAFGASSAHIFFSTDQNFDNVYLLDTSTSQVTANFGLGSNLTSTGSGLELATNAAGDALFVLERFGSPGGLHKINVSNPTSPSFIAEDDHGDLGSNCRGLAVIPGGIAPPSQGHEAYIACGAPYHVQAITVNGALITSTTQFITDAYPIGVETLSNGDVLAVRDTNQGQGLFLFNSAAEAKETWIVPLDTYEQVTDDGVAGTLVDGSPRIYLTLCGNSPTEQTNCSVQRFGGSSGGDGGGDEPGESPIELSLNKTQIAYKGGVVKITATIAGESVSAVVASARKGSRTITAQLAQSAEDSSVFTGKLKLPKNKSRNVANWEVTVSATVDGDEVSSDPQTLRVKGKKKGQK